MAEPGDPFLLDLGRTMAASPHVAALGLELVKVEKARAEVRVAYREDLIGDPETRVIAGGVITAMLDHVCGIATVAALAERFPIATLDLRIDYLRAARPDCAVHASAHCFKVTRSVAFLRALAYETDPDDPIATASAAFMLSGATK